MRPTAWFSIVRCYGLNGFSHASHSTIAQESKALNIPMSAKRAHYEKEIGLCILGYDAEFNRGVRREVEKTFHKKKGEKKMSEQENPVAEVNTEELELTTSDFQETVDDTQRLIEKILRTMNDLKESIRKNEEEKSELLKKLEKINKQLLNYESDIRTITEGVEYFTGAKETFERKPIKN